MQHRNLTRYLLTSKLLHKHNKTAPFEITHKRLTLLTCIQLMQHYNMSTAQRSISDYLLKLGRSTDWLNLYRQLEALRAANLLYKDSSNYKITIECLSLLQSLETKLRAERFDR